jgi:hypothetical protein
MRKTKPNYSDRMDGEFDNIPDHFKNIYDKLYNCVNDAEEVAVISNKIENSVQAENIKDVDSHQHGHYRSSLKIESWKGGSSLQLLLGLLQS